MRTRKTVTGSFSDKFVRESRDRGCSTGGWTSWTQNNVSWGGSVTTKTVSDVLTPGFHAIKECGGFLPLNPFVVETHVETREPGDAGVHTARPVSCSRTTREARGSAFHVLLGEPNRLSPPSVPEGAVGAVVNAAVADARQQAWDALTFVKEWEQTRSMFSRSISRVSRSVDHAARFAKRFKKNPYKAFSEKWLELRFGWLPAIHDLNSAVDALSRERLTRTRGRGYQSIPFEETVSYVLDGGSYRAQFTEVIQGNHSVRGFAMADMSNPFISQTVRVDPLLTTYEVIPFSFVVDYFIQVGTWLEATSPVSGGLDLGSCASVRTSYTHQKFGMLEAVSDLNTVRTGYGPLGGINVSVERYERFPHGASLPSWNPRINLTRATDLFALVTGLTKPVRGLIRI